MYPLGAQRVRPALRFHLTVSTDQLLAMGRTSGPSERLRVDRKLRSVTLVDHLFTRSHPLALTCVYIRARMHCVTITSHVLYRSKRRMDFNLDHQLGRLLHGPVEAHPPAAARPIAGLTISVIHSFPVTQQRGEVLSMG